jgi:hypothetical protein
MERRRFRSSLIPGRVRSRLVTRTVESTAMAPDSPIEACLFLRGGFIFPVERTGYT